MTAGLIERYRDRLPVTDATPVVSLGEGSTPLVAAPRLSALTGLDVHLKYEGLNPTGSFKDRGMTVAVSKALEEGATHAVCASTGNTSASAAAYCGRAGIRVVGESSYNLLIGILVLSFTGTLVTGVILVWVFLARERNLSELQADFVSK